MTNLTPWRKTRAHDPLPATLGDLHRGMDDLIERFFGDTWGPSWPLAGSELVPAVDLSETADEILVKAELPGLLPEQVEVSVVGDTLVLSGEKKQEEQRSEGENVWYAERRFGTFRRSLQLPSPVDADKVAATFKDGVLTVRLPRSAEARPRQIKVKAS